MSTTAPVRTSDPYTSREAAASVTPKVPATRVRVLTLLTDAGQEGLTHDELIRRHRTREAIDGWPGASVSSLRTRCNELVCDGLAESVPGVTGRSSSGRKALRWRATNVHQNRTDGQ